MLVLTIRVTKEARSSQYSFQKAQGRPSTPNAFVEPIERIALFMVEMPTQFSSKGGVSLAMLLMKSRALAMVLPVAKEVWTLLTSFSIFSMKKLLHAVERGIR